MDIQAEIERVRQELNSENQRGGIKDSFKVAELEGELENLIAQLTPVPEKIEDGSYFLDALNYEGIDIKELFLFRSEEQSKAAYELLRDILQNEIAKIKHQDQYKINLLEEEKAASKEEAEANQTKYDELYEQFVQKRNDMINLQNDYEDMAHKRDASATELLEAKAEITRLNGHIDDLRKQIAVGAKNIEKVVDVTDSYENYKKAIQDAAMSLPVIYNVRPLDTRGSRFAANYAETDKYLEDYYMYLKGNYREVSADEAPSFRRVKEPQHTDADNQRDLVEESELTPPTFQSGEEDSAIDGVDEGHKIGDMATKTVEERLQALESGQDVINSVLAALANRTGGLIQEDEMKVA